MRVLYLDVTQSWFYWALNQAWLYVWGSKVTVLTHTDAVYFSGNYLLIRKENVLHKQR